MPYKEADLPELRPCPFCGSEDVQYYRYEISGEQQVDCNNCHILTFFNVDLSDEEAIALWNKRAGPGLIEDISDERAEFLLRQVDLLDAAPDLLTASKALVEEYRELALWALEHGYRNVAGKTLESVQTIIAKVEGNSPQPDHDDEGYDAWAKPDCMP